MRKKESYEQHRARNERYKKAHPEKWKTSHDKWRKEHPEESLAAIYAWQKANRNKCRFASLKYTAKKTNRQLTLSYEDYLALIALPCFYCGGCLPSVGYGIDRINSDVGYVQGNCRPCCDHCNTAKNSWTEAEFKEWALRLFNHWVFPADLPASE